MAGIVECPTDVINKNITRNVSLECWLGFEKFDARLNIRWLGKQLPSSLKYKLQELVCVDPENFQLVCEAVRLIS